MIWKEKEAIKGPFSPRCCLDLEKQITAGGGGGGGGEGGRAAMSDAKTLDCSEDKMRDETGEGVKRRK